MGIFDKAKEFAKGNPDKVSQGLDKAGDVINQKTGGKYEDKINTAKDKVSDSLGGEQGGGEQAPEGGQPEQGQPGQ